MSETGNLTTALADAADRALLLDRVERLEAELADVREENDLLRLIEDDLRRLMRSMTALDSLDDLRDSRCPEPSGPPATTESMDKALAGYVDTIVRAHNVPR